MPKLGDDRAQDIASEGGSFHLARGNAARSELLARRSLHFGQGAVCLAQPAQERAAGEMGDGESLRRGNLEIGEEIVADVQPGAGPGPLLARDEVEQVPCPLRAAMIGAGIDGVDEVRSVKGRDQLPQISPTQRRIADGHDPCAFGAAAAQRRREAPIGAKRHLLDRDLDPKPFRHEMLRRPDQAHLAHDHVGDPNLRWALTKAHGPERQALRLEPRVQQHVR
jgi:hypothetical protein